VGKLFKLIREVYDSASRRISTGELNRFVANLHFEERKIYYITQHSIRPPSFAVFTDKGPALHFRTSAIWSSDAQEVRLHRNAHPVADQVKNRAK